MVRLPPALKIKKSNFEKLIMQWSAPRIFDSSLWLFVVNSDYLDHLYEIKKMIWVMLFLFSEV